MNKIMHVGLAILLFFSFSTYSEGNEQASFSVEHIEELREEIRKLQKDISEMEVDYKEARKDIKNQLQDDYLLLKKEFKKAINMVLESEQINNDINHIVNDMINVFKNNEEWGNVIDKKCEQLVLSILALTVMHLNPEILNEQKTLLLCILCAQKMSERVFGLFFEKVEIELSRLSCI